MTRTKQTDLIPADVVSEPPKPKKLKRKSKSGEPNKRSINLEEAIMQAAVDRTTKLLIAGVNEFDFPDLFRSGKVTPDCREFTQEQIGEVIERAKSAVRKITARDGEFQKALIISQFEDNYKLARNERDYKACADILSKKAKVLGLGEESKNEVSAHGAIEIIHTYNTLGDRTDATIDLKQFGGDEAKPFPEG